ncbi:hypothetical protein ACFUJ0_11380 [Streptomyces sp. NPDC057242]|uniref:hypothetical protein n=1 Tax=unclassified Streptomyces TaxID=2593676 RepID=UPI0036451240
MEDPQLNNRRRIGGALLSAAALTGLTAVPAAALPAQDGNPRLSVTKTESVNGLQTLTFNNGAKFTSGPAVDTGALSSFSWSSKFQIGFYTRHYTSNAKGTHTFKTGGVQNLSGAWEAGCTTGSVIEVTMYAEDFPYDDKIGTTKTLSCTNGGTASWTGISPDTFYYYVKVAGNWDSNDLYSRGLSGSVSYP